jgi:hypothetical protein
MTGPSDADGFIVHRRSRCGFTVLRSEVEMAPVFHGLPERIKAQASICVIAPILYRVMRQRLKLAGAGRALSPP